MPTPDETLAKLNEGEQSARAAAQQIQPLNYNGIRPNILAAVNRHIDSGRAATRALADTYAEVAKAAAETKE